jgi:predicted ATPase
MSTLPAMIFRPIVSWSRLPWTMRRRAAELALHFERGRDHRRGLELLPTLPDTPERRQFELDLLLALGPILIVTKGWTSPDIERTYGRARGLCRQLGETPQLFPALFGLWLPALVRLEMQAARALAEELLTLAQRLRDPALLLEAHWALGITVFYLGEFASVREHMAQGMALYEPQQHHALALLYTGTDVGVNCRLYAAWALWYLGYPAQALHGNQEALALAQELAHPFSHAFALHFAARLHQCRQEGPAVQKQAEASVTLCTEHGFALYAALGTILQGWGLIALGQGAEGLAQMRQGLTDYRAMGGVLTQTYWLALLAEAYGREGQVGAGLTTVGEALAAVDTSGERFYEAELYRLKGELTLQAQAQCLKFRVRRKRTHTAQRATLPGSDPQAEACFQQALAVARHQQAKALELRAAMSLSQLWQQQGKKAHARQLLAEVYGWFTEGFDTVDLHEAKALLEALGE